MAVKMRKIKVFISLNRFQRLFCHKTNVNHFLKPFHLKVLFHCGSTGPNEILISPMFLSRRPYCLMHTCALSTFMHITQKVFHLEEK